VWKGEYARNAVLLEKAEAEIRCRKASPLGAIRVKLMLGIHYWLTAKHEVALGNLSEGLQLAAETGVHVFDSELWSFRAAVEMTQGRMEPAQEALRQQMSSLASRKKTLDAYYYHVNAAWHALLQGAPSLAAEHLQTVSAATARLGTPYYRALWHIGMTQTEFLLDRPGNAAMHLRAAQSIAAAMKSQVLEWYAFLIEAWLLLEEEKETEGLLALHRGLSLGRRYGFVHLEFCQPAVMRLLCARALEENIEPEHVQGLILKLALAPPVADNGRHGMSSNLEAWPFPVKIYTLGRFEVHIDGKPLVVPGKEQKKPLELLKSLIALGASEVPVNSLTDALWPEADGDLAHKSFEMALSRLRRLLGGDSRVLYRSRRITLNPQLCWVDTLALGRLLDILPDVPARQVPQLCDKALALYRGGFLDAGDAPRCAVSQREVLKSRVLSLILATGCAREEAGEWERAAEYYARGIEMDHLAEEFHRRLMQCQRQLGNHSDAVRTYLRCRSLLRDELGIEPSPETTAVYLSIVQRSSEP
jgi:DNA-binding SARP family transcriptional activator